MQRDQVQNPSGLRPKGVAVLVRPYEPELAKAKENFGLIIPIGVQEKTVVVENRATVIEIGAMAWHDEKEPRAKVGDVVLITKFAGFIATGKDATLYRLVNDRDIFCVVEES